MRSVCLLTVCASLLLGCFDAPVQRLAAGGFEVRRVSRYETPPLPQEGRVREPGDFVLSSPAGQVVVGGMKRLGELRGAVLEAHPSGPGASDGIVQLSWELFVGGRRHLPKVSRMFIVERAGHPVLRQEATVTLDHRVLAVSRELRLTRYGALLTRTRVSTLAPRAVADVRLAARVGWGGPHPFVPEYGLLDDGDWHRSPWLGVAASELASVFSLSAAPSLTRGVFEQHGSATFLLRTEHIGPAFKVSRDESVVARSVLVFARGGLAAGVRRLRWARGRPGAEAWVTLPHRPPGAEVRMASKRGRPLLAGRPDLRGKVALPLPRGGGPVRLTAHAYGHAPSRSLDVPVGRSSVHQLAIPRGGQIRVRARDGDSGGTLPVRVRLVGIGGTASPQLGPDHRATGAGDSVVTLQAENAIVVPPGRYRVNVTHGPEWSVSTQEVEVTETFGPQVDAYLLHEVLPGDWVAADLHVHAAPSPDSEVTLVDRVLSLAAEGVRFAVPTDHNHVTDYAPAAVQAGVADFGTLPGVEVTTWEPAFGHFNAYPYPHDPARPAGGAPPYQGVDPGVLFAALHAMDPDLIVQVNHPRLDGGIGYFERMSLDARTGAADPRYSADFDALEVFNGFDLARPEHTAKVFQEWLALLQSGQRVVATGSSDSHEVRYQLAGYPRTYVRVPGGDVTDGRAVVRALAAGRAFVTSGPFVEVWTADAQLGEVARAEQGAVQIRVRVRAPSWMATDRVEVFRGSERVVDLDLKPAPPVKRRRRPRPPPARPTVRFDGELTVAVEQDDFLVVRVSSEQSIEAFFGRWGVLPIAFTNPLFVDGDGDGATPWGRAAPLPPSPDAAAPPATPDAGAAPSR